MAKKTSNPLADRFALASDTLGYRTIASVEGEVGVGKTHFCFTAPGPILSQNIDLGTEGVVEKFRQEGKEIYEEKYEWNPGGVDLDADDDEEDNLKSERELKEAAIEVRNKWEKDFHYFVDNGGKSIVEDTESRIWQVYRYAEFGGPNGEQRDYDKLNLRFEGLVNKVKSVPGVNLFLIRSMKDRWGLFGKVNQKTGQKSFAKHGREVWGYEHLAGCVFMELTFARATEDEKDEHGTDFVIRIGKCRHSDAAAFKTFPRCSFPQLGCELVEGSSPEDWE